MRRLSAFALLLVIAVSTTPAFSQTESTARGRGRHQKGHLLKRSDTNHNGRISRDEWTRNPRAFDRLDRNHDGAITGDEAHEAARERVERRQKALEGIDKNSDGWINRDEWPRRPETFDRLDQNHDGELSRDELARGRKHPTP
jgi:Ca2+-binding EF-hand superfamily protein